MAITAKRAGQFGAVTSAATLLSALG
jgi:hypothetical protein